MKTTLELSKNSGTPFEIYKNFIQDVARSELFEEMLSRRFFTQ